MDLADPINPSDPRLYYSAERTLLAWVRTSLALMGFGFIVARFGLFLREMAEVNRLPSPGNSVHFSLWIGAAMIAFGIVLNVLALWNFRSFLRAFRSSRYQLTPATMLNSIVIVLSVLGIMLVIYLIRLVP